jgi:glycosyltransferase involved in cell wall biosynthesis
MDGQSTEVAMDQAGQPDVWVIIPSYNEGEVLDSVLAGLEPYGYSVVVVDDGSTVPAAVAARRAGVHYLRHCVNLGQGAAIQTGLDYARESGARYLVTFDADGQHAADEIASLVTPLRTGTVDVALGTRFAAGGQALNISAGRRLALRTAILLSRWSTGLRLTDTHNGFRALTAAAAAQIRLTQNRMAHASQILEEIARLGLRYVEVPVTIRYTAYSLAKGQRMSNAFNVLWESVTRRFS